MTKATAREYKCGTCGAKGVKLWRYLSIFAVELECRQCMYARGDAEDKAQILMMGEDGLMPGYLSQTDQVCGCGPAVQDIADGSFWGYTSIPADSYAEWQSLPNGTIA